ncbi:MAG: YiiX/YebB-like N1pC/P60 family cysteine hydrolase [Rhodoferax sp.]|nr:YiiX/YebB-like N1pC/P60 family cysteine hydrolase [Rhodoferax sp.]MDP3653419.1 YiiX/YebB-like N1pC/P60 family cysteine hydrolase [Rhodoferax sp.]
MPDCFYALKRWALTIFGDIRIFRWPLFVVYQPTSFRIKGRDTREVMDILRPGDVIMRAYDDYLDGYFIPKGESGCSHSGLYIGDNHVVHSIAEGSMVIDVIDFCRTDKIIVLRPDRCQAWAIEHARKCADANIPYNFDFSPGPGKYYCHEFTASCYPELHIETVSRRVLGLFASPKAFLADSFYTNRHFTKMYFSRKR